VCTGAAAAEVTASPGALSWGDAADVASLLAEPRVSNALQRTARWGAAAAAAGAAVQARAEPDAATRRAADAATQALIARMQKELQAGRAEPELPVRSLAQQYTPASKWVLSVAAARAAREAEKTRAQISKLESHRRVSTRRGSIVGAVAMATEAEAAALRAASAAGLHAAPYIASALWASFAAAARGAHVLAPLRDGGAGRGERQAALQLLQQGPDARDCGAVAAASQLQSARGGAKCGERSLSAVRCLDAVVDVMALGMRGASVMGAVACCAAGDRVFATAAIASGTLRDLLEAAVSHASATAGEIESDERHVDVSRRRYLQISASAVALCARGCSRQDGVLGSYADYLATALMSLARTASADAGGDVGFVVLRAVAVAAMYIAATANVLMDLKFVALVSWLLDQSDPVVVGYTSLAVMEMATTEDSLTILWREKILQRLAALTSRMVAATEAFAHHAEYARALANVVGANWRIAGTPAFAPKWRSLGGTATCVALLSGRQFGDMVPSVAAAAARGGPSAAASAPHGRLALGLDKRRGPWMPMHTLAVGALSTIARDGAEGLDSIVDSRAVVLFVAIAGDSTVALESRHVAATTLFYLRDTRADAVNDDLSAAFGEYAFERVVVDIVDREDDVDTRRVTIGYLVSMLSRAGSRAILESRAIPVTVRLLCDCSDTDEVMEVLLAAALRISAMPACQSELGRIGSTVLVKISLWSDRPTLQASAIRVVSNLRHCAENVTRLYKLELTVGAAAVRADWAAAVDAGAPLAACAVPTVPQPQQRARTGLPPPLALKLDALLSALDAVTAEDRHPHRDERRHGGRARSSSPTKTLSPGGGGGSRGPPRAREAAGATTETVALSARARAHAAPAKRPASAATALGSRLCSGGLASLARASQYTSTTLPARGSALEPASTPDMLRPLPGALDEPAGFGAATTAAAPTVTFAGGGGTGLLPEAAAAPPVSARPSTSHGRPTTAAAVRRSPPGAAAGSAAAAAATATDTAHAVVPSAPTAPRRPMTSPRVRPHTMTMQSAGARLSSTSGGPGRAVGEEESPMTQSLTATSASVPNGWAPAVELTAFVEGAVSRRRSPPPRQRRATRPVATVRPRADTTGVETVGSDGEDDSDDDSKGDATPRAAAAAAPDAQQQLLKQQQAQQQQQQRRPQMGLPGASSLHARSSSPQEDAAAAADAAAGQALGPAAQKRQPAKIPPLQLAWAAPIIADHRMGLTELMSPIRAKAAARTAHGWRQMAALQTRVGDVTAAAIAVAARRAAAAAKKASRVPGMPGVPASADAAATKPLPGAGGGGGAAATPGGTAATAAGAAPAAAGALAGALVDAAAVVAASGLARTGPGALVVSLSPRSTRTEFVFATAGTKLAATADAAKGTNGSAWVNAAAAAGAGSHASRWRPRLLAKFPHMPGSRVCESLFGHFLAADGTLVHFFHRDVLFSGDSSAGDDGTGDWGRLPALTCAADVLAGEDVFVTAESRWAPGSALPLPHVAPTATEFPRASEGNSLMLFLRPPVPHPHVCTRVPGSGASPARGGGSGADDGTPCLYPLCGHAGGGGVAVAAAAAADGTAASVYAIDSDEDDDVTFGRSGGGGAHGAPLTAQQRAEQQGHAALALLGMIQAPRRDSVALAEATDDAYGGRFARRRPPPNVPQVLVAVVTAAAFCISGCCCR
jgi:hypothetical protein